jgi:hypothetical protein
MIMNQTKRLVAISAVLFILALSVVPTLGATLTPMPIPNAQIEVTGIEGEGMGVTGSDGTFQFSEALAKGTYSVTISAKGYLTTHLEDTAIEASKVKDLGDIVLNASAVIKGKVVDPNGNPIGPAFVSLELGSSTVDSMLTDDQGNFAFDTDVKTGTYTLMASTLGVGGTQVLKEGYSPGTTSGVKATEGSVTDGVLIRLSASGIISGKVTDMQGNPLKNMMVIAFLPEQGFSLAGSFAYTDANGAYRITNNLATGTYNVTLFFPSGYVWSYTSGIQVQVQAGQETKDVNFQLEKSAKISGGVIYSDGSPAPNASVVAFSTDYKYMSTNKSDVAGKFILESNLGTGDYALMATAGRIFSLPVEVHVDAGQEVSGITITLSGVGVSQAIIEGTITDDKGKALVDAEAETVSGVSSDSNTFTDENGKYALTVYLPEGQTSTDVQVMGLKKGYENATNTVHVEAGKKYTLGFQLAPKDWGTLKGRIVAMISKSPAQLTLSLSSSSVPIGTAVTISGALNPAGTGKVSIYTSFGGSAFAKVAEVDLSDGAYSYSLTPTEIGTYAVIADWPGDDTYAAASSSQMSFTVTKIAPTISLSLSSTSVSVGDSVTASGTISPFSGSTTVDLVITAPDGTTTPASVTSTDGTFSYAFTGNAEGSYSVQASIPASDIYNAAQSSAVSVQVQKKCVIATATFGSELSPEVSFLRGFRNDFILKTYTGSKFYVAFDAFYYSWSTPVAVFIAGQPGVKAFTKLVIYPLIGALELTASLVLPWSGAAPEVAAIVAGFMASCLIGLIYFFPPALAVRYAVNRVRKIRPVTGRFLKYNAFFVLITVLGITIGVLANSAPFTTIATSLYILSNIVLASSAALYALERKTLHK